MALITLKSNRSFRGVGMDEKQRQDERKKILETLKRLQALQTLQRFQAFQYRQLVEAMEAKKKK